MEQNSKPSHRLITSILLVSLFLHSCSNFSISSIPKATANQAIQELPSSTQIIDHLVGKELISKEGHVVTFHEEGDKLQADVKINVPEGFSKTYTSLPVKIAQDIDLQQLAHLSKEEQKRVVHFNPSNHGQQASVSIFKEGLLGGMKRSMKKGDEEQENEKRADFETVVLEQEGTAYIGEKKGNKCEKEKEKGSEESLGIPSSTSRAKHPNDLPRISYNEQALLEIMNKLPMGQSVKKGAILYLKNIQQKINEIDGYQLSEHTENFYYAMKGAILEIKNTARLLYEFTKPYNHILSNTLQTLILKSIAPFERELEKRLHMPVEEKEVLRIKTKRLYAEQSYITRQGKLQKKLLEHLSKIKQLLMETANPSPYCYISYAWTSKENQQEEYWVQPFLSILYNHLSAAGIRLIMDIRDNKPGDSIYKFMEQYHDGNHIILVGTESLLQKHRSIVSHAVKTELSIINNRFEEDQKTYGYSRIYPLLISGTSKTSFPDIYDKYRTVQDPRDGGYLLMLQHLINWICERQINKVKTEYENLWRNLDANCLGLARDAEAKVIEQELSEGYHRQRLDYLKQDLQYQTVHAQEETKHSSAVAAEIIGVLMKSQGNNPKLLYNEYGQQFQRPSITSDFIERERLSVKIVAHFEQSDQQILTLTAHGLGGMGKTELARYYYLYPPRPYALRAWFNAENREQLYSQYVELAKAHGIQFEEKIPIQEQARLVKNWLETQKDCLLVYDNVPNAKQLERLLPEDGKHHILITSRNEVDWPDHQKLDVDVMEEDEAIALICKITGHKEETVGLKELANTLGCLPLALAQAGAYIAMKKTSIEDYLNRYRKYQSRLMNDETLTRNPKHEPVWVTFNMNFKALDRDCPNALLILKQASWLDASAIPELLLQTMLEAGKGESVELLWDDIKMQIGRYSLMRINSEGHQLSMHQLLQDILRSKQDELEKKEILNQVALSIKRIYPENDKTVKNITLLRLLLPHIETILSHLRIFFNESECADFNLEFNLGDAYKRIGHYAKSKENFHVDLLIKQKKYKNYSIKMNQDVYTGIHSDIAMSLDNLGLVDQALGNHQEALQYYKQALKMRQTLYTDNHPDIASSLNNIGTVYEALGQHQEALAYHHKALAMHQASYGGNHPDIAISFHNLGSVYQNLGQHQKALEHHHKALEMHQALYNDNSLAIASSFHILGSVYQELSQHQAALNHLEQALKIYQNLYNKDDHPDIAGTLNIIGNVYYGLKDNKEALQYYKQALVMRQALYIGNHPAIASSLHNIGTVYEALAQPQEALKYLKQALEMHQALYSGNHPDIANTFNNIGMVYKALAQPQEALKYLEQALEMYQSLYPNGHPGIWIAKRNIAQLQQSKLRYNEEPQMEAEVEAIVDEKYLLECANNNDVEAQFLLGTIAYNNWQQEPTDEAVQETIKWLKKAAIKGHEGAIDLLEEMKQITLFPEVQNKVEEKKEKKDDNVEFRNLQPGLESLTNKSDSRVQGNNNKISTAFRAGLAAGSVGKGTIMAYNGIRIFGGLCITATGWAPTPGITIATALFPATLIVAGAGIICLGAWGGYTLLNKGGTVSEEPKIRRNISAIVEEALKFFEAEKYQQFIEILFEEDASGTSLLILSKSKNFIDPQRIKCLLEHNFKPERIKKLLNEIGMALRILSSDGRSIKDFSQEDLSAGADVIYKFLLDERSGL